jgi:hypothetical protein
LKCNIAEAAPLPLPMPRRHHKLYTLLCCSLAFITAAKGPAVIAVSIDCDKGFLCPASQIRLVETDDATTLKSVTTLATLVPAEKTSLAHETITLTAKSVETDGLVYALVIDPSQAVPFLSTINTTTQVLRATPAAAILANTTTLNMFPPPIGLVAATADGRIFTVDTETGTATALPVTVPKGLMTTGFAGGMSTTDGKSRLFLFCHDPVDLDDDSPPPSSWYVAAIDLAAAVPAVKLSAGAPYGGSLGCTYPIGMHYNSSNSGPAGTISDTAAAIIQTTFGPFVGTLNLANVSDFHPLSDGFAALVYLDYTPVDRPQSTFLLNNQVFFALMHHSSSGSGTDEVQMTWVNFTEHHPPIHHARGGDHWNGVLVV